MPLDIESQEELKPGTLQGYRLPLRVYCSCENQSDGGALPSSSVHRRTVSTVTQAEVPDDFQTPSNPQGSHKLWVRAWVAQSVVGVLLLPWPSYYFLGLLLPALLGSLTGLGVGWVALKRMRWEEELTMLSSPSLMSNMNSLVATAFMFDLMGLITGGALAGMLSMICGEWSECNYRLWFWYLLGCLVHICVHMAECVAVFRLGRRTLVARESDGGASVGGAEVVVQVVPKRGGPPKSEAMCD